jgi:hypothetical protein
MDYVSVVLWINNMFFEISVIPMKSLI